MLRAYNLNTETVSKNSLNSIQLSSCWHSHYYTSTISHIINKYTNTNTWVQNLTKQINIPYFYGTWMYFSRSPYCLCYWEVCTLHFWLFLSTLLQHALDQETLYLGKQAVKEISRKVHMSTVDLCAQILENDVQGMGKNRCSMPLHRT